MASPDPEKPGDRKPTGYDQWIQISLGQIRGDIGDLKNDLKADISEVKEDLRRDMRNAKDGTDKIESRIAKLERGQWVLIGGISVLAFLIIWVFRPLLEYTFR